MVIPGDGTPFAENQTGIQGSKLYVDPRLREAGRPVAIASQPTARWLGEWTPDVRHEVDELVTAADKQHALAQLVIYNIPGRDNGGYSAGGAGSSAMYRTWINDLVAGIGRRRAVVIIEPDALSFLQTLKRADQALRLGDIAFAVSMLSKHTEAFIYIDAGHSDWCTPEEMAERLGQANVESAHGFSLNVSNFKTTKVTIQRGNSISERIGGKHYVIDTSRNGQGPPASNDDWCNPEGRGLGENPTTNPRVDERVDAFLWIKIPGESDGSTHGGPEAGEWFEAYANTLISNAVPPR